jgi:spore coat polysaccharide biosynthesis predicted glycosyltransferase SpsG
MVKGSVSRLPFTSSERGGIAARFISMVRRRLTKEQRGLRGEKNIYESQLQALVVDKLAVNEEYGRCKRSKRGSMAVTRRYAGTLE